MAQYQVPQFLDSGDKIFLNMNIRQLAYFLAGFGLCAIVFNLTNVLIPGFGIYALIPCLGPAAIFGYMALGSYNGRDSEVYIFKLVIYLLKPRVMSFVRMPDFTDIYEKYKGIDYDTLNKKYSLIDSNTKDKGYLDSNNGVEKDKIAIIRELSRKVDESYTNTLTDYRKSEKLNERRREQITKWNKVRRK